MMRFLQKILKNKFINIKQTLLCLTLFTMISTRYPSIAISYEWQEFQSPNEGREWLDKGSLVIKRDGSRSVITRFTPSQQQNDQRPNSFIFTMDINCDERIYRDTSINGVPNKKSKWESSNGDSLIEQIISEACSAQIQ